jgi:hypothetical protein
MGDVGMTTVGEVMRNLNEVDPGLAWQLATTVGAAWHAHVLHGMVSGAGAVIAGIWGAVYGRGAVRDAGCLLTVVGWLAMAAAAVAWCEGPAIAIPAGP